MPYSSASITAADSASSSLEVRLLGVVEFDAALHLQERLAFEIAGRDDPRGALLLCEHPPVITIGREGSTADILVDQRELDSRLIGVRRISRGGGCLLHAPGQLAVYPIVPLDRLTMEVGDYRRSIESAVFDVCRELVMPAWSSIGGPGMSCRGGQFAFVGAAVRSCVSIHGMWVNVCPAMELQRMVRTSPSGPMTSIAASRARRTSMHTVREALIRNLAGRLGYERFHIYTSHPLLQRTMRKVYVPA